jgi:hypothetical protein
MTACRETTPAPLPAGVRRPLTRAPRDHQGAMMKGLVDDIEAGTERNRDFRRVLYTGPHLQLVVMSLDPGEEIGEETHEDTDQFFRDSLACSKRARRALGVGHRQWE